MMTTRREKLTQPLGTVTNTFGILLLGAVATLILVAVFGRGAFLGLGRPMVCVTEPYTTYGSSAWTTAHMGFVVHHGAQVGIAGSLQACTNHPGAVQRVLYTLTRLPALLVWACILFLLWRLIRAVARTGPFTAPVAQVMRRLGWVIIAGALAAGLVQALALNQLLNTMVTTPMWSGAFEVAISVVSGVLPVPALAAAALLTFARIIRLGADMDDELAGTV
jgi:hypothetical protein